MDAAPRQPYFVRSKTLREDPACAPLREMLRRADRQRPRSWSNVETAALKALSQFDDFVAAGKAGQGAQRNGKGEFFNDLLAIVLSSCAEVDLVTRPGVPGLIFPTHNLDATYPPGNEVVIEFLLEAKTAGTPRHPGNPKQRNELGRPGRTDLPKRIKETGFKTIDLKAEYGRIMAAHGRSLESGPSGDMTTWLRSQRPHSCLFLAVRVVDKRDEEATIALAHQASLVMDSVGLFCYTPVSVSEPTRYRRVKVPSTLEIGRVLHREAANLQAFSQQPVVPLRARSPLTELAEELGAEGGDEVD